MEVCAGQRVVHPVHGYGIVLAVRDGGRARVRFLTRDLLPVTVPRDELEPAVISGRPVEAPEPPSAPVTMSDLPRAAPADPSELPDLRQAVEALRLGVVPAAYVRDYTVAREREIAAFEALLEEGSGLRLVWGDYGAGKTHLLDIYERMALAEGFVASRVTLDPRETPPSHPQRLFREIVRSLRYPDVPGTGLDPLFLALEDSPDHRSWTGSRRSRILSPVLYSRRRPESEAAAWAEDYIEGYPMDLDWGERQLRRIGWRGPRPLSLSDYRTFGRMYVNLVGTIAAWAGDAGHAGLVVLFDEVEYIEMVRGDSKRLAEEVLQHYAAATLPPGRLAFLPDQLYRGGRKVHRAFPLRFSDDQRLSVVMALTPLPEARAVADRILADRDEDLELTTLRSRDYADLVHRVARLYSRAYPDFRPGGKTETRVAESAREDAILGDPTPREVVRRTVLELDAERLSPARSAR